MGAAAGAHIRAGENRDAHRTGQLLLAAVGEGFKFLGTGPQHLKGMVFPDVGVGFPLNFQHTLPRDVGVVVDDHALGAHVEAGVVAVVGGAEHTGDNVLAGVLLHVVKAALPVDLAVYGFAHGQGFVAGVDDHAVLFLHIAHLGLAQCPQVAGLAAALGVECGAVQHHGEAFFQRLAGYDGGVKCGEKRIVVV